MSCGPTPTPAAGASPNGRIGARRRFWLGGVLAAGLVGGCAHYEARPIAPEDTAAAFGARSLADASLRAFLAANHVAAPGPQEPWDLKQLTLVAFFYQPALAEARSQLLAAQAAQVTAAARPNPSLSLTPGYDAGIPDSTSPWIVPLSFDLPIETAGKRGYRMAQARAVAEAARWDLVAVVWQVRSQVRAALLALHAAQESDTLLAREEAAQNQVVRLLEGQLDAGVVSSYEVTQARIAVDATRLARQQAVAQVRQSRVQLAGALGVPVAALEGCRLSFLEFARLPRELTAPEVRRDALLNRADVRGALAEYAASQAALQLEIANQYPDIHLGPGYAWNTGSAGDSEWDLGLSLTLPIRDQNQGPIAEAKARRAVAAAHFQTIQAQALNAIEAALAAYSSAQQQVATAATMQQNLRRRLEAARAQVQAGEAEPLTVANAEVEFAAAAQTRLDTLVRAQQALGQLEDAVQSPLTLAPDEIATAGKEPSEGVK